MFSGACSKVVRKSIARVLTVINQNKKQAVREAYADKVLSPPPAPWTSALILVSAAACSYT